MSDLGGPNRSIKLQSA